MTTLSTGAEMRVTGSGELATVVCVNGGQSREVAGTWSASLEWLVKRLAGRVPGLAFAEVRYRVKSWRRLDACIADARAAVARAGSPRVLFLGFSMGGAVAIAAADEPGVAGIVALAPWIPERLDLRAVAGKPLSVIHGGLDRPLPGVPGVTAASSRRGVERARAAGADARHTVIPWAVHGVAVRGPGDRLLPLPRAARWAELVESELVRLARNGS